MIFAMILDLSRKGDYTVVAELKSTHTLNWSYRYYFREQRAVARWGPDKQIVKTRFIVPYIAPFSWL